MFLPTLTVFCENSSLFSFFFYSFLFFPLHLNASLRKKNEKNKIHIFSHANNIKKKEKTQT